MSQRYLAVNEEVDVILNLKVTLKQLSNHDGFENVSLYYVFEEFRNEIKEYLKNKIVGEFHSITDLSEIVDSVQIEVEEIK